MAGTSRIGSVALAAAAGALLLAGAAAVARPYCTGDKPDAVLGCLEQAFADRDTAAYEALLAPDYRFEMKSGDGWDRGQDLAGTNMLFTSKQTTALRLDFGDGYRVTEGDEPGTWILSGVTERILVVEAKGDTLRVNQGPSVLEVRRAPEPVPHYEIYSWKNLED